MNTTCHMLSCRFSQCLVHWNMIWHVTYFILIKIQLKGPALYEEMNGVKLWSLYTWTAATDTHSFIKSTYGDLCARSRYLRHGQVIASHRILPLALKSSYIHASSEYCVVILHGDLLRAPQCNEELQGRHGFCWTPALCMKPRNLKYICVLHFELSPEHFGAIPSLTRVIYLPGSILHCRGSPWLSSACSLWPDIHVQLPHFVYNGRQPRSGCTNSTILVLYGDVTAWKRFLCYWPFWRGIHRQPMDSPPSGFPSKRASNWEIWCW